jgi:cyclic beta-1,2-glucan synthetase
VLGHASDASHQALALASMEEQLHDRPNGLMKLLAPPFAHSPNDPGYIQAYPPGVRENGGQYSHAAVWAMMALALAGDTEGAWQAFEGLSPAHRARHAERGPSYEIEPYVMAGDVYAAAPYVGRGGWSWYTGSAAWMHRACVETLLGLRVQGDRLSLTPRLPKQWPGFELSLRLAGTDFRLRYGTTGGDEGDDDAATHRIETGEWIDWRRLPPGAVVSVAVVGR